MAFNVQTMFCSISTQSISSGAHYMILQRYNLDEGKSKYAGFAQEISFAQQ
jgi:hypothetical protein